MNPFTHRNKYRNALLIAILFCSCNSDYITQRETRTVDNNGKKWSVSITRKLRKHDRLPVSVLTESTAQNRTSKQLDSIYYDSNGAKRLVKSFTYDNGDWKLVESYRPL